MLNSFSNLEIRHLRLVAAINQTQNLTKAAELLHVSQPAASQCLKDLEGLLGTPLFVRTKKRMILTHAGEKVLESSRSVLSEMQGLEIEIDKMVNGETGELHIGMHCVLSWRWLPIVMKRMQECYPRVKLSVGNSRRYVSDLLEKKWDVVVTAVPHSHPALEFSSLFSDEILLVTHPDHPLASKKVVDAKDFQGCQFISLAPREKDFLYNMVLVPEGIELGSFMTIEQPDAIVTLIREGFGIAILPRWAVQGELKAQRVTGIPISSPGTLATWNVVRLGVQSGPPYQETFIEFAQEALDEYRAQLF